MTWILSSADSFISDNIKTFIECRLHKIPIYKRSGSNTERRVYFEAKKIIFGLAFIFYDFRISPLWVAEALREGTKRAFLKIFLIRFLRVVKWGLKHC